MHKSLGTTTCRYGSIGVGRTLPGLGLPSHVEVTLRDDEDHVQRASYRIVRR